jgi:hypothetical protein
MKEVVKAILLDPEARGDVKSDPRYGKLREPVQLMTNLYRNFNVSDAAGTGQSDGDINRFPAGLGQNAFTAPTVFNYYPPNFIVPGTTLLAPEFGIFTTGTSIGRANMGNSIIFGQINVLTPEYAIGYKDQRCRSSSDRRGRYDEQSTARPSEHANAPRHDVATDEELRS